MKEITKPVLVPTKDSGAVAHELALSVLCQKLVTELRNVKASNPDIKFGLDEDTNLIFFSEQLGDINLNKDISA